MSEGIEASARPGSGQAARSLGLLSVVVPVFTEERTHEELPRPESELLSRFDGQGSLRERTARGVMINSAFQIGFAALSLLQRFAVAAFLTASQFGVWGLALSTLITLSFLKQIGISDKYIQQNDPDQEVAFQKAFTLEFLYTLCFCVLVALLLPLYAVAYGRPEMLLPGLVLVLSLLGTVFQTPNWVFYRRMQFVRQRVLEGVNPVVGTAVMVYLAAMGAGYWSLALGMLIGNWAAGIAAVAASPYRLAFRLDRGALREYVGFSWPVLAAGGSGLLTVQGIVFIGNYTIGLAGLGALALAASLLAYAQRVDQLIARSIYPAICAVRERRKVMFEAFTKSNRVAIMWGLPFGLAMLLFAPDLVRFVLGERWHAAQPVLQTMGVLVGIGQIGVSWRLFYQASGNTRPLAVSAGIALVAFLLITGPLMIAIGLTGFMIGMSAAFVLELLVRAYYLRALFRDFSPVRHLFRGIGPSIPAVAAVLAVRLGYSGDRTLEIALAELALYIGVTIAATIAFERALLRELVGYLRKGRIRAAEAPVTSARAT
jgi:O-antigen/teichoic acid export membrane protein